MIWTWTWQRADSISKAKAEAWARISTKGGGWWGAGHLMWGADVRICGQGMRITINHHMIRDDTWCIWLIRLDWPSYVRLADRPFSLQLSCWPLPVCISMDDVAVPTSQRSTASNCFKCTQAHVERLNWKGLFVLHLAWIRLSCKWWFDLSSCEALKRPVERGQSKRNSRCQRVPMHIFLAAAKLQGEHLRSKLLSLEMAFRVLCRVGQRQRRAFAQART